MRKDRYRLEDILEAIDNITRRTEGGKEAFLDDEMVQTWVIHHLQIIGEAARCLSESVRAKRPDIPWPQIIAFRNILIHEYFGVVYEEIWEVVENQLTSLRASISDLLFEEGSPD